MSFQHLKVIASSFSSMKLDAEFEEWAPFIPERMSVLFQAAHGGKTLVKKPFFRITKMGLNYLLFAKWEMTKLVKCIVRSVLFVNK